MIAIGDKKRFESKEDAKAWLKENGFKAVRGMKETWISETHSAQGEYMPASGRYVLIFGKSDRV